MEKKEFLSQFITPEMLAKKLKVSKFTIYRWIKAEKLKAIKLTSRNFFIAKKDLNQFIKRYKTK